MPDPRRAPTSTTRRTGAHARGARPRFRSDLAWALDHVEPWPADKVVRRDPTEYRQQSIHLTWRCVNPHCGHWTMNGAWRYGRCNLCDTPRPET